jgi:hypothetical protein
VIHAIRGVFFDPDRTDHTDRTIRAILSGWVA